MDLAFAMLDKIMLAFEPFRAFNAVPLSQTWEVLWSFRRMVLRKVFFVCNVPLDLVEISAGHRVLISVPGGQMKSKSLPGATFGLATPDASHDE